VHGSGGAKESPRHSYGLGDARLRPSERISEAFRWVGAALDPPFYEGPPLVKELLPKSEEFSEPPEFLSSIRASTRGLAQVGAFQFDVTAPSTDEH
jgi:hypothetical protein